MKPVTKKESRLRGRFQHPHDTWNNHDQAVRIARQRWKRKLHHHQRTQGKDEIKSQQEGAVAAAAKIVNRLLEADPDSPEVNMERYAAAIGMKHAQQDMFILDRFKRGVKAYIKWAHTDEQMGPLYDPADLRRITRARDFATVLKILRQYETEPSFLSMAAQGYFN